MRRPLLALALAIIGAVLLIPGIARTITPEAEPPEELAGRLDEFRDVLTRQLELPPTVVRYTGAELGPNDFVVLQFELRPFPFMSVEGAYLVSHCVPLRELDPWAMGGGRGVVDFERDPELTFLRAQADDDCR